MAQFELKKLLMAAAAVALVLSPELAFAQSAGGTGSGTFAGSVETLTEQAESLPQLISVVLYVIGIALVGKGILTGKKYSENPGSVNGGLFAVLGPILVGALLIAAPSVANIALSSANVADDGVSFQGFDEPN